MVTATILIDTTGPAPGFMGVSPIQKHRLSIRSRLIYGRWLFLDRREEQRLLLKIGMPRRLIPKRTRALLRIWNVFLSHSCSINLVHSVSEESTERKNYSKLSDRNGTRERVLCLVCACSLTPRSLSLTSRRIVNHVQVQGPRMVLCSRGKTIVGSCFVLRSVSSTCWTQ